MVLILKLKFDKQVGEVFSVIKEFWIRFNDNLELSGLFYTLYKAELCKAEKGTGQIKLGSSRQNLMSVNAIKNPRLTLRRCSRCYY